MQGQVLRLAIMPVVAGWRRCGLRFGGGGAWSGGNRARVLALGGIVACWGLVVWDGAVGACRGQ